MQNDPNQQPTPEPEQSSQPQLEQPAVADTALTEQRPVEPTAETLAIQPSQAPVPVAPAPVQSPTQPGPNNGQPTGLSAQKLLDDYENDRDRHDLGKIMVIGSVLMVIGGITLMPIINALFTFGPAVFAIFWSSPVFLGSLVVSVTSATAGALLVFRKELGRIAARTVAVVQLIFVAINAIASFGISTVAAALGADRAAGTYIGTIILMLLSIVFYVWVFMFLRKQSVRNLFRP